MRLPLAAATGLALASLVFAAAPAAATTLTYRIDGTVSYLSKKEDSLAGLFDTSLRRFSAILKIDDALAPLKSKGPTRSNPSSFADHPFDELAIRVGGRTLDFGLDKANYVEVTVGGAARKRSYADEILVKAGDPYRFDIGRTHYAVAGEFIFGDDTFGTLADTGLPDAALWNALGPGIGTFDVRKGGKLLGTLEFAGLRVASVVPEPATWTLMIAAFALLGHAARRRRRALAAG
ncbi:MAG: PEPxxWA-CTERM sorting domain-containing protein [Alphaproteobacteria bacterium]|nr:PEPxxWA-CTERM sorting domain-containing protein [Alphaproteobacteria bacterium]